MKRLMAVFVFLITSLSPGFAQIPIDAPTRQDVEDLMQLTGARERIPLIYSAMAGQFAAGFAARYQQQHSNANPAEVQKAATEAAELSQQLSKAIPSEELLGAMIPGYQRVLCDAPRPKAAEEYERHDDRRHAGASGGHEQAHA